MTASPIVSAALDRGYTLDEVANKLSEQAGLDPATIRARGYDSAEILAKLGHDVPPQVPVGGIEDPSGAEPRVGAQQVYATKPNTQGMKFDEHGQPIPMGMDATVDKQIGGGTQNAPTDNATALAQRLSSNPTSPTIADAKELALSNPASPENRDRVAADNASELGVQIQQDQADRDFHQESINTGMHWNYDKQTTVQHYLHQISQGELDSETLGLAPQFNLPPQSGGEEVARAAGDLAGFIGGPGLFAAKGAVGLIGGLEHVYGESVVKALAKDVIAQSATLGLATGLGATGEALRADNWQDATKIIAKATASGEGMGAIFGAFARIFPDNTIPQFLGRMVGINTAMDLAGGTNPTDNRSLEKKFYDYGLNSWFALRGAGRTEGGWIHDKASTTQEHADIIDKVGVGNPDVGIDDAIAAAHTAVDEPLAKDRTVAQILSDFQQKKPLPEVRNGTGDEGANDAASVRGSVPGGNNNGEGILPDGVRLPAGGNLGEQGGISATDAGAGRQGVAMEGQDANLPDAADKGNGVQPGLQDATANTELGRRDYELHGQTITSDELDAAIQQHKDWLASNHIEHRAQPEENGEAAHAASINEGAGKSLNTDRPGGKTAEFFTKMTLGEDGKPGAEYTPTLDLSGHQEFMDEYGKHRGNFDNHIRASIPGFGEVQVKTGDAIRQAYPKGARVLDIGASEGSWAKTISSLSGGKIKTDSLEPLESMADHFKNISTVPGAKHYAQAWGDEGWTEPNGFEVKPFKVAHKYDVVHEAMTFQFIDNNRQEQIARAKDAMKPSGVLMLEEKFANDGTPEYAQREAQKDEYKGKYFTKTAIADKAKDTLVVGMNDSMAKRQALEDVLASKFKYVKQYWSAGNFGGYAASDSKAALDKLVDKVGDTNSKYSGQQTPRDVTGRDVMINVGLKTTDGKGITEAQVRDELDKLGIGISKAAVHPPQYDGDEEKFAARISRPLTPEEAHQFSADLNQEAITQVVDGKGELYGPNAEGWKPYQAKYFTKPEGGQLSHPEIVGTHFSTERRDVLSGEFNGSGLKGRDAARLLFNEDPRINTRLSFYVDEGNGVHPEAGVGNVRHDVKLNNLYDAGKDPLKLRASGMQTEEQANAFESAVLDHGFSGYYIKGAFSKQGAAVLLGDAAKDVRPEGGVQMSVSAKQTETPAFKEWFGGSKVVNADGTPRIMYHATSADFNAFKRRIGDVGIHFGTQGQAEDRGQYVRGKNPEMLSGANTIPVYLHIYRPLRMEDAGYWNADNMVWVLKNIFPSSFKTRAEMRYQNDYTRAHPDEVTEQPKYGSLVTTKDIREFIQSKGYDGIVYKNTGEVGGLEALRAKVKDLEGKVDAGLDAYDSPNYVALIQARKEMSAARDANQEDSYIAFERNQIKSALGNNGDFNSRKPDITKSQGEHSLSTEESEFAKQRAHPDEIPFTSREDALATMTPGMRKSAEQMIERGEAGKRGGLSFGTEEENLQRAATMMAQKNGTTAESERTKLDNVMQNSAKSDEARAIAGKLMKHLTPAERTKLRVNTAQKMVDIFDQLPSTNEVAAVAYAGKVKRGWYRNSAHALTHVFGADAPRFTALLASMSPQNSLEMNLRNALKTWKTWIAEGRPTGRDAIVDIMGRSVEGNKLNDSVLDAWKNNSVRALSSEDPSSLTLSGPKVHSFMENLRNNVEEVTNDAWMSSYFLLDKTIFKGKLNAAGDEPGKSPGYLAVNAKIRAAAKQLTKLTGDEWTPSEVQETVWSWAKTIYEVQSKDINARQALDAGMITDELLSSTPDFRNQLHEARNEKTLNAAGYGEQLSTLRDRADITGPTSQTEESGGKTAPFDSGTQRRLEQRAADRLSKLRVDRNEQNAALREQDDEDPFGDNVVFSKGGDQTDRDEQVSRLQEQNDYSREDALRDYTDGTRIDEDGKEYRLYFSRSTIMQHIEDILHNPSQSLIDKDIALNKLLGGGDETISARVGQAKDTNWVAKQISGLLDWADPGHIERALENIRKSPLYSRGVHVNAFYHPDIGQIFVNTDRVSNHDVPGIILHEVSHAANNDKLNSEVMHRLNVAEAIQHGFLGPQKSVVDSDGNEIMYSPLKRMLGELQQNKGTPEQWEGILNNFKQKGIKPDELENTQILDQIEFLKDHNVKVIKKEDLMKWLEEHEINVEPHIYGYGGQGGGGTPEFEFRYGNWATEEPDDYWLQERGREQLGEMSPDDLRQQIEDMNEEQPSDEEIEKLQNQYGWNNRVRIEEYKDVTGTMAAEGKKFSVLRNGEVLKDFTTKAKAEKYVESILPNADTMALKEKLEEAAYEKERGYYYQDDESPAYRNISVMAGEDNYHFQHRMGYGDHEIYDSLLGNTLELGNTRRFDDADLESALRQHLMEKYDVYEGDEEGSPKYDDEDYNLPGGDEYRETVLAQKGKSGEHYNKGHFSVRDQIAHERADMREVPVENIEKEFPDLAAKLRATGDTHARIYFIQEHQADRAHEGREKPTVQVPYTHEDLKVNEAASSGDPEKLARYEVRKVVGPNDDLHHEPRYAVFEKSTTASPTEGRAISRLEYSKEDAAVQRLVLAGGERWIIDADNHDGTHSEMSRNKQDYPTRQDAINSLIKEERAGVVKGKLTAFEATKKANALQKQLSKISQQMEDNTSAYKDADRTMVAEYDAQRDQIPADQFNQRDALRKAFQTKQDELAERHAISRNALSEQQHPLSDQLSALPRDRAVPGAYVESTDAWEKLLFQHAIVQAKKEGAHLIAWTTADQQTARWSGGLRKKVDTIEWDKSADGQIHIRALQGRSVRADTRYGENDLSAAIGKTMARRIIEDPNQSGKIEGKDIVVADLGMSKVYGDSAGNAPDGKPAIMAKVANQLLKQMGGDRVQEANLRPMKYGRIADETEVSLQPAFEITNKMGEAVDKGLPQFSKQSSAQGDIYARVRARMEASGEVGNSKEATSYLVEEAMNMGRTAGHSRIDAGFWAWATKALPASVVNTLRQWVAAVRAAMFRNGIVLKEKDLTVDDFVAVAKANMHDLATGKMDAAGGKEPVTGSVQSPVLDKRAEAITELHAAKDRMDKLERMDVPEFDGTTPELHDARSQYNAAAKAAADLGVDVQDELHNPATKTFQVAFKPEQVKSAIGNNGAFDAANPDIRMSKSGPKFVKRDDVLDEKAPGVLAKVGSMVGAIKTGLGELKNAYLKEPEFTESKRIIGKYIGALQEIDFDLSKIAKEINLRVPADRQVAITNYMQAGGDEAILKQRATTGFPEHRKGYEDALTLTPVEKQVADFIQGQLDIFWRKANEAGILEGYVENYVRGQWQKENSAGQKTMAIVSSGMLNDKPREAMRKVFQNYFEGEQLGFVPVDKRIGYQFVAGQRSIRAAIAARQALTDMMHATEKDGRPMVAVGGGGSMIGEDSADKPYFVKPNIKPADSADYKSIDHPAMRKWKWVGSDDAGKPIMMQGNMYIHPEAYGRLNALLGRSAIRSFEVPKGIPLIGGTHPGDAALKAGAFVKGTILIGPFHQFHLGEHAVFHGVNPLDTPEIDFDKRPLLREGVEHGLMLYNYNAMFEFAEGLASGGLLHKLPYAGDALRSYQEWLFQDYIPRLKAEMFEHAVKRAEIYYAKDLASGKFTRDQLLDNAAKQGNAAFGELNYKYMGRNPTYQDALRIALLAPDFLEARFKFAGQAVRPRGKEQAMAFIRGGLIMGLGAQTINAMFGDDKDKVDAANRWSARAITNRMHWDRPFSVVINGREYSPRSVPADMLHLITDPRGFWYNRINPLWGKPVLEIATGKDINGQTESLVDGIKSILTGFVPIPVQGAIRNNQGQTQLQAVTSTLLQSIGVSNFPAKTAAEKLVGNIAFGHRTLAGETEQKKKKYNDYADLKNDYMDGKLNSMDEVLAKARAGNMLISKPMMASIKASRDTSPEGKVNLMEHRMRSFTGEEVLQVFEKMDDSERAAYKPFVLSKIAKSSTMTGPEKLEAIRQVQSK